MRYFMKLYYKINTYGCQMNVHESEKIAGQLIERGYLPTDNDEMADVIIFNTCCIRDNAERRAFGNVGALKKLKRAKKSLIIAMGGCMTQQPGVADMLRQKFPFIDIIFGTYNLSDFGKMLDERLKNGKKFTSLIDSYNLNENVPIYRTSGTNAWVNIIYGCNNFCTYCIVPHVRGRETSRDKGVILDEIKRCLDEGYKEITLLGQNVNSYGNDRGETNAFASLLTDISKIEGKFRLRFMTSHPKDLSQDVVDIMASSTNICNNIHLPVQSGSTSVLKDMNRKYTREHYLSLIDMIRSKMPNCGITTDIMVGFPTETEDDFLQTMSLVEQVRFLSAFTFVYSPRNLTPAAKMPQLDECIKKDRITRLIDLQNEITLQESARCIGGIYEVLCEDKVGENIYCGRTDEGKLVSFESNHDLVGQFVNIRIDNAKHSALFGKVEV